MPKVVFHDSTGVEKMVQLGTEPLLIGRATECQIQTQDAMVSRRHARISYDGNYWVEDLGSSNGVFVAGERVQRAPFRPGDTITCGSLVLRLIPETAPKSAPGPVVRANPSSASNPAQPAQAVSPVPPVRPRTVNLSEVPKPETARAALGATVPPPSLRAQVEAKRTPPPVEPDAFRPTEAKEADAQTELVILRRKVEQLTADLRRAKGGGNPAQDAARVAELSAALERVTGERDSYKARAAQPAPSPSIDQASIDLVVALSDSIVELRSTLHAANDEAALLREPPASVQIVAEALRTAAEQLEAARSALRALQQRLGGG